MTTKKRESMYISEEQLTCLLECGYVVEEVSRMVSRFFIFGQKYTIDTGDGEITVKVVARSENYAVIRIVKEKAL